ncbi:succinate-semialdehyde dehydrogenase [Patellaria atrata CBS 101060]|uniref:Succinate-semialdehyde dehydrogenase n=1 Tax=Patellaria atrata CBS 101060 TaxID=1346257 RepID=A0A9P4SIR1_9PEZI|nr:succinate-semialdehyde dehydrogenase [Patellaria atrata CBS 101060]
MEWEYEIPFKLKDPSLLRQRSYVDGEWVDAQSGKCFDVIDPGTGKHWASVADNDPSDVNAAVESSYAAFQTYRRINPKIRAKLLLRWNDLITEAKEDIARIVTYETGKPLAESLAEVDYALGFTWFFTGEAERIHGTVSVPSAPNRRNFTVKQPIGVAVALVPWNFPVAMILRKAGAALAAGCTMVIKPSPETPLSVLALVHLASRAGFEKGVLNVLTTSLENTPALSEALCKHPLVSKVTFTGSTKVGKLIARHCSEGLKKVTLELGGNCPFLIFDDANLKQSVDALIALKWRHAGQACITANRVYIQKGVFGQVEQMLIDETRKIKVGHGIETETTMGPVTTPRGIEKVECQIKDAQKHGGTVLTGGKKPYGLPGYFFEPTIISNMKPEMLISREETFGPILSLYKFETEDEVVDLANKTSMGLASYFFTKDVDRTWRLLENLEAGMVGMNTGPMSAAESPFGGIKESGYGKESGKDVAVDAYLITKTGTMTLEGQY